MAMGATMVKYIGLIKPIVQHESPPLFMIPKQNYYTKKC
jgi:hypothetical protein